VGVLEETSFKAGEKPLRGLFEAASIEAYGVFRPPYDCRFDQTLARAGEPLFLLVQEKGRKEGHPRKAARLRRVPVLRARSRGPL
jgi:hypothetical protein